MAECRRKLNLVAIWRGVCAPLLVAIAMCLLGCAVVAPVTFARRSAQGHSSAPRSRHHERDPRHARARHAHRVVSLSVVPTAQRLQLTITAPKRSACALSVAVRRRRIGFSSVYTSNRGRATLIWTVPSKAPSGRWRFTARCRRRRVISVARTTLLLINHGHGTGSLREHDSTKLVEGDFGGKGSGPCAVDAAADQYGHCVRFPGDPFDSYHERGGYAGEDVGQCTWYAAGRRPDLWGITRGNANTWLKEAIAHGVAHGSIPVPGAIAVDEQGEFGHVAYVVRVSGSNVIVDDSNYWGDEVVHYEHPVPASDFAGYIYGGPAGNGPSQPASQPPISTPVSTPTPTPTAPSTPESKSAPPPTFAETTGGLTHTWTDYLNAGGLEGSVIPANDTVQIACKITGFKVEDGDTWWYKVASAPWNGNYYASADAFYNDGQTSGTLIGTPFVDEKVPSC